MRAFPHGQRQRAKILSSQTPSSCRRMGCPPRSRASAAVGEAASVDGPWPIYVLFFISIEFAVAVHFEAKIAVQMRGMVLVHDENRPLLGCGGALRDQETAVARICGA